MSAFLQHFSTHFIFHTPRQPFSQALHSSSKKFGITPRPNTSHPRHFCTHLHIPLSTLPLTSSEKHSSSSVAPCMPPHLAHPRISLSTPPLTSSEKHSSSSVAPCMPPHLAHPRIPLSTPPLTSSVKHSSSSATRAQWPARPPSPSPPSGTADVTDAC